MLLNLLLNSAVDLSTWTGTPAPLASLALTILLKATQRFKSIRVKVKSFKEVGYLARYLAGHIKSVMLKSLLILAPHCIFTMN